MSTVQGHLRKPILTVTHVEAKILRTRAWGMLHYGLGVFGLRGALFARGEKPMERLRIGSGRLRGPLSLLGALALGHLASELKWRLGIRVPGLGFGCGKKVPRLVLTWT